MSHNKWVGRSIVKLYSGNMEILYLCDHKWWTGLFKEATRFNSKKDVWDEYEAHGIVHGSHEFRPVKEKMVEEELMMISVMST